MNCPFCNASSAELRVIDTRHTEKLVRRRRTCTLCNERFSTMETITLDRACVTNKDVVLVPKGTTILK